MRKASSFFLFPFLCLAIALPGKVGRAWESALYGPGWQPTPALSFETDKIVQDFSFAGYRRGEVPLPVTPPGLTYNVVTTYGADPTGAVDSTVAIQSAIDAAAAAGGGIVWLPAGLYKISPQGANSYCLQINASGVVLRGAGAGQTFLLNTQTVMRDKNIISVTGPSSAAWTTVQSPSTNITTDLPGPVTQIPVVSVAGFAVGDHILVRADPGDAWATEHLEDGWVGYAGSYGRLMYLRQIVALDAVNHIITLDIPTRYTLKTRDAARVYKKTTLITETGLEGFSIGNVQFAHCVHWPRKSVTCAARFGADGITHRAPGREAHGPHLPPHGSPLQPPPDLSPPPAKTAPSAARPRSAASSPAPHAKARPNPPDTQSPTTRTRTPWMSATTNLPSITIQIHT